MVNAKVSDQRRAQRSQEEWRNAKTTGQQAVHHAFFGGVEPLHCGWTQAGVGETDTSTNQQTKGDHQHNWCRGKGGEQHTCAYHACSGDSHQPWPHTVLQNTRNHHTQCKGDNADGIRHTSFRCRPAQVRNQCLADNTPGIQNAQTKINKDPGSQDPICSIHCFLYDVY